MYTKLFLTACSSASAGPRDPYRYLQHCTVGKALSPFNRWIQEMVSRAGIYVEILRDLKDEPTWCALEKDSRDGLLEMYSRDGLSEIYSWALKDGLTWWVAASHCRLHGGEGWRSSRPLPIHHSCNISPFKCQRSLLPLYWVDRLPDKVHLGADKDVKDETLIRFRKTGIPDRGSLKEKKTKNTKRLF